MKHHGFRDTPAMISGDTRGDDMSGTLVVVFSLLSRRGTFPFLTTVHKECKFLILGWNQRFLRHAGNSEDKPLGYLYSYVNRI